MSESCRNRPGRSPPGPDTSTTSRRRSCQAPVASSTPPRPAPRRVWPTDPGTSPSGTSRAPA